MKKLIIFIVPFDVAKSHISFYTRHSTGGYLLMEYPTYNLLCIRLGRLLRFLGSFKITHGRKSVLHLFEKNPRTIGTMHINFPLHVSTDKEDKCTTFQQLWKKKTYNLGLHITQHTYILWSIIENVNGSEKGRRIRNEKYEKLISFS